MYRLLGFASAMETLDGKTGRKEMRKDTFEWGIKMSLRVAALGASLFAVARGLHLAREGLRADLWLKGVFCVVVVGVGSKGLCTNNGPTNFVLQYNFISSHSKNLVRAPGGGHSIPACAEAPETTCKAMSHSHATPAFSSSSETETANWQPAQNRTW